MGPGAVAIQSSLTAEHRATAAHDLIVRAVCFYGLPKLFSRGSPSHRVLSSDGKELLKQPPPCSLVVRRRTLPKTWLHVGIWCRCQLGTKRAPQRCQRSKDFIPPFAPPLVWINALTAKGANNMRRKTRRRSTTSLALNTGLRTTDKTRSS